MDGRRRSACPGVRVADDLVDRDFAAGAPNRCWVADITYLRTWEGWLYLVAVLDLFSRRIVGWAMADHLRTELVIDALEMALAHRRPAPGLIQHSDQGSQFVSARLRPAGPRSRDRPVDGQPGDCFDNAVAESFFATLKKELIHRRSWPTKAELRTEVFDYIETFYNRQRRHSTLGQRSPADYENSTRSDLELLSPLRDSHPPTTSTSLHQLPTPPKTPVSTKPGEDQPHHRPARPVSFDLISKITIPGGTRLATRFASIPDVPVTKFTLSFVSGPKGPLGVAENLCSTKARHEKVAIGFRAQNGTTLNVKQPLNTTGC